MARFKRAGGRGAAGGGRDLDGTSTGYRGSAQKGQSPGLACMPTRIQSRLRPGLWARLSGCPVVRRLLHLCPWRCDGCTAAKTGAGRLRRSRVAKASAFICGICLNLRPDSCLLSTPQEPEDRLPCTPSPRRRTWFGSGLAKAPARGFVPVTDRIGKPSGHFSQTKEVGRRGRIVFTSAMTPKCADGRSAGLGAISRRRRCMCAKREGGGREGGGYRPGRCLCEGHERLQHHPPCAA